MFEHSSRTTYETQFRQEFTELDESVKQAVAQCVSDLVDAYAERPWAHPDVKRIVFDSDDIWRLKVKEKRGSDIDHRVFFDITDEGGLVFFSVQHRDDAYQ